MTTRLYYEYSTGRWLHRVDTNIGESLADARLSCAVAFGVAPGDVGIVENDEMTEIDREALVGAMDWSGEPPGRPQPTAVVTGKLLRPVPVPLPLPEPTAEERITMLEARVAAFGQETGAASDPNDWLTRSKAIAP